MGKGIWTVGRVSSHQGNGEQEDSRERDVDGGGMWVGRFGRWLEGEDKESTLESH